MCGRFCGRVAQWRPGCSGAARCSHSWPVLAVIAGSSLTRRADRRRNGGFRKCRVLLRGGIETRGGRPPRNPHRYSILYMWTRWPKSNGIREREARKAVLCGIRRANGGSSSASLRECQIARTAPQTPGEAQKRPRLRALRKVERQFHLMKMVEAVGIEPTSDGQSLQPTTSVSCVLLSHGASPQAGLSPS